MFGTTTAFSSVAVDDLTAARQFYGQTLGLKVSEAPGPLWLHIDGSQDVLVYPKPDHTPASFTVLNFSVDDIDRAVDDLTARGVRMERYEGLETDDRGIHRGDGRSVAWFTDSAGNVLSVVQVA